jgi:hypothetical protein
MARLVRSTPFIQRYLSGSDEAATGNGKTISIKATMHTLYQRKDPIPTLYVKTLAGSAQLHSVRSFS